MDRDDLFIATLEDLRRRTDLRATEYDMVQAAGLMRRLVMDGRPLYDAANRRFRLKPVFRWGRLRVAAGEGAESGAWVPGGWLDPVLMELHPSYQDEDVQTQLAGIKPWVGSLSQFLAHEVIVGSGGHITVRELVKHYANREGGIHYDETPPDKPLLAALRDEHDGALRLTVLAAGRILYRGLEPLAAAIMLAERPGPFGLRTDGSTTTPRA